jgi:hypothetical protein
MHPLIYVCICYYSFERVQKKAKKNYIDGKYVIIVFVDILFLYI